MHRWGRLILTTLLVTTAVTAAVIGMDWVWHRAPGSAPVAAVIGDPRVRLSATLPTTPVHVPIYEVSSEITPAQVERLLGGNAKVKDGWLNWTGKSQLGALAVMRALNPGVPWGSEGNSLGPAPPGLSVRTGGLSSAFTGTAVVSTSFGTYQTDGRSLVRLSIPAHRITRAGTIKVIPAAVALLDIRHHRKTTRLLPDIVPLLPQRLAGAGLTRIEPITDVRLVEAADPANPGRSKPVWVFDPVAEADAQR